MAESTGAGALMTSKWGPMPVWVWALGGLLIAWGFAKYRDMKNAASTSDTADTADVTDPSADEGQNVAPQFIIENNMPQSPSTPAAPVTPSAPVTTPTTPGKPVVTAPVETTKPPVVSKPPSPAKPAPAKKSPIKYKVVHGDNLTTIAKKYHTTAAALYKYNTTAGVRPAATIAELKKRGPNLIYAGETILIPQ